MSSEGTKPAARQPRVRKPKFYEIRPSLDKGRPGFFLEDNNILTWGELYFPDFPEPPGVIFDRKIGHLPRDLELFRAFWLVSERTKAAFEAIDPRVSLSRNAP
jgi:hypothetical protein